MVDILLIISYLIIYYLGTKLKYFPFYFNKPIFSIGLMYGNSPFHLSQSNNNPIITPNDIKDFKCRFVADPFLYKKEHTWYIFYEAMDVKKK